MPTPLEFTESIEQPPADEREDIAKTLDVLRQLLQRSCERSGRPRRDVHVKAHGCAVGEFRVMESLPAELAQGLFAQPRAFPAFARFSNAAPWPQPDALPDARGLALQVEHSLTPSLSEADLARTQDFVMANHASFIARDVKDYLRLEEARLEVTQQPTRLAAKLLMAAIQPFHWRWRALFAAAGVASQFPSHPASYTYYSMVPFRFGRFVAKYRIIPDPKHLISLNDKADALLRRADAMRLWLEESLARQSLHFHFQIQLRTSEASMPIEDATVRWPESESPYRSVAELELPRQDVSLVAEEGERKAFSVWNCLAEHRPLGGINRVRREAYALSAGLRRGKT